MVLGLLVVSPTSGLTGTRWNLAIKVAAFLNYFRQVLKHYLKGTMVDINHAIRSKHNEHETSYSTFCN
jgi:hypothetical protein